MVTFIVSVLVLIVGYVVYGKIVERHFGVDPSIKTPAYALEDGVDYKPMATWKVFVIQFLNIAVAIHCKDQGVHQNDMPSGGFYFRQPVGVGSHQIFKG